MPTPSYRYPWPASALTAQDMALLHGAREASSRRTPITALVAEAVRASYGRAQTQTPAPETNNERKAA